MANKTDVNDDGGSISGGEPDTGTGGSFWNKVVTFFKKVIAWFKSKL